MTCKRKADATLIALALVLAGAIAGCSDGGVSATAKAVPPADPAFVRILREAEAAMAAGALADARRKLDEASVISPDNPDLWVAIAQLRYRGGQHLTALDAANRALELGPRHAPALLMRAMMVRDAHGFAVALPWFEAALAADPDDADVWAEYAATLGDAGRGRAMLLAVRKLAQIAPDDPRVFYLQAVLAARGNQYPLARSLLVRSGMAKDGVPAAMLLDGLLSFEERNFDSASATLESLSERQPANARLRELLARALLLSGRNAAVVERFAAEAQRDEASPYLIMLVGRAHERLGERTDAAPLLARAYDGVSAAPVALATRRGLAQPVAELRGAALVGDWGTAMAQAQRLQVRFPASADVASLAGDVALGTGNLQEALLAYAAAAKVRRPWPLTRKVAFALRSAGDAAAADTLLARHVAGEPDGLTGIVELAQTLAKRGDWARAALLLDHAIRVGGGHDPVLLSLRVKAAQAMNRPADARNFAMLLAEVRTPALNQR